jgi:hypothetical protein
VYNKLDIKKSFLENEYIRQNKTLKQIAKNLGCSISLVANKVREFEIFKRKHESLVGLKIKKFTVLERLENDKNGCKVWLCQCVCGEYRKKRTAELKSPNGVSCGCEKYKTGSKNKKWKGHGDIHGKFFYKIKSGATKRKYKFDVDIEYIWDLFLSQNKKCALTGIELYFPINSKDLDSGAWNASLDRIDNDKGYIEGNVQWVHKHINIMKWVHTEKYFIELCNLVSRKALIKNEEVI